MREEARRDEQQRHWTDQDLVEHLYGVGPADGHLDVCADCRTRWRELAQRRDQVQAEVRGERESAAGGADWWAAQRRSILRRAMTEPGVAVRRRSWLQVRMAPALALAGAVVLAVILYQPPAVAPLPPAPPQIAAADRQLVNEAAGMLETPVPASVAAISGLFEEDEEN